MCIYIYIHIYIQRACSDTIWGKNITNKINDTKSNCVNEIRSRTGARCVVRVCVCKCVCVCEREREKAKMRWAEPQQLTETETYAPHAYTYTYIYMHVYILKCLSLLGLGRRLLHMRDMTHSHVWHDPFIWCDSLIELVQITAVTRTTTGTGRGWWSDPHTAACCSVLRCVAVRSTSRRV